MDTIYQHADTTLRGYSGIWFDTAVTSKLLNTQVKDILRDTTQKQEMLDLLEALKQETGFERSQTLLQDIKLLQNTTVDVQYFRIGEALAEVVLEGHFNCRFYWNELRDVRNPKGNKTGADLVGFIEIDNEVLFLFGEVKTSSEENSPPQVMTNPFGIEKQLKDLYQDSKKRLILISYIQSKISLLENKPFKIDFKNAITTYYKKDVCKYLLYGVLVRDTNANENDVKNIYSRLKSVILEPTGLKLLAVYLPIKKENWLDIINGAHNESQ